MNITSKQNCPQDATRITNQPHPGANKIPPSQFISYLYHGSQPDTRQLLTISAHLCLCVNTKWCRNQSALPVKLLSDATAIQSRHCSSQESFVAKDITVNPAESVDQRHCVTERSVDSVLTSARYNSMMKCLK